MPFQSAISQTLVFGQFLGLMPVIGAFSNKNRHQILLNSLRILNFCVISASATFFLLVTFAMIIDKRNFSLESFIKLIVYLSNLFTIILFFKLGKRWKILISSWSSTVKNLPLPGDKNFLRHKLNLRLFVIASSSLSKTSLKHTSSQLLIDCLVVEYTLQTLTKLSRAMQCEVYLDHTKVFYIQTYPSIFNFVPYSPVVGFVATVISYTITLTWAYRDLFIINIAFSLKRQFFHLNEVLLAQNMREMPVEFWSSQRLNYRKLTSLVNDVDESICKITFLSFAVNAFFICVHLFDGL